MHGVSAAEGTQGNAAGRQRDSVQRELGDRALRRPVHRDPAHAVLRAHGGLEAGPVRGQARLDDQLARDPLQAQDALGAQTVTTIEYRPYQHAFTYDILPDSDSGTYVAAGALVGSTLRD